MMTKVETLATAATWIAMNAIGVLIALTPLSTASERPEAPVLQASARA